MPSGHKSIFLLKLVPDIFEIVLKLMIAGPRPAVFSSKVFQARLDNSPVWNKPPPKTSVIKEVEGTTGTRDDLAGTKNGIYLSDKSPLISQVSVTPDHGYFQTYYSLPTQYGKYMAKPASQ